MIVPSYNPKGVCSVEINFEIDDEGLIHDLNFIKGCSGNAKGIAKLAEGRSAQEIIELFKGITCGNKSTSCPDQLAQALTQELESRKG